MYWDNPMPTDTQETSDPNSALRSGANARVALCKQALEFDTTDRVFFTERTDYQGGYRWDTTARLLLWGPCARDWPAMNTALLDFKQHFTPRDLVAKCLQIIAMRLSTLRRQTPEIPWRP